MRAILGHRRLSIIDVSPAGHQPMTGAAGRVWLTFNGEIYNFVELRRELAAAGHRFASGSDTEVLLAAYLEWGEAMLTKFVGMYAFGLLDLERRRLLLARDPFGIKPLYLQRRPGELRFASEPRALLALDDAAPAVDAEALFRYLRFGVTDGGDATLFAGMTQLPAGHRLSVSLDEPDAGEPVRYWGLRREAPARVGFEDAARRVRELFDESVAFHLRSDVPLGSCLSGGLDSSAIVLTVRALLGPGADIRTFSFIADDPTISEAPFVELVRQAGNLDAATVAPAPEDLADDIECLIRAQGEPFGSTSIYAQYRVFRLAREAGVTVMLDGQGSDELFGGYNTALSAELAALLSRGRAREALTLARGIRVLGDGARRRLLLSALGRLAPTSLVAGLMRVSGEALVRPWMREAWFRDRGVRPAPRRQGRGADALREELIAFVESLSLPQLLRYEDRSSMAFSIESRVPFCVPALAEYALSLPSSYLVRSDGTTKAVFREAMRGRVPDPVLARPKVGFATPEQAWLARLRPWIGATLREAADLPFLDAPQVAALAERQLGTRGYFSPELWRVLNAAHWVRLLGVRVSGG
jgi:asparagine synthase (glutamine-hydrolysing)